MTYVYFEANKHIIKRLKALGIEVVDNNAYTAFTDLLDFAETRDSELRDSDRPQSPPSLKVKLLRPGAVPPVRATNGSGVYYLCLPGSGAVETAGINSMGISVEIPAGHVGLLKSTSKGPIICEEVIDSDYRDELKVRVIHDNLRRAGGEIIAQLIIVSCFHGPVTVVEALGADE